jgi:carboxyl-terminal processing protease
MRVLLAFFVVVWSVVAPDSAAAQSGPRNCTRLTQNLFVRDVLDEYYYWYRELPIVNPANFASPEAYLEAVRYRPLDETFSYITSRAANEAFYGESQFVGFGFSTQVTEREMRVLQVFPDSPASEAGFGRGDRVLEIDGRSVAALIESGDIGAAFGASEPGVTTTVLFRSRGGEERRVTMTKRVVTIPTVSLTRTFDIGGRKVGYVFFRNFVNPSFEALDEAFAALKEAGATELVLDVRYNGGGLVDVAVHLASLVGGTPTQGRVFATFQHNDKNSALNEDLRFETAPTQALNLSRLFVVTTRSSASASELIINSLRPHVPVVVVGDATYGKPVGQYGFTFCDKVLAPVAFKLVNSEGQGDFFGGIQPDCRAGDDIEHDLGSAEEASLAEALTFIRTGACSTAATSRALRARAPAPRAYGWQSLVNAH